MRALLIRLVQSALFFRLSVNVANVDVAMTTAQVQFQSLLMALDTKISASSHDFMTKMRLDQEKQNLQVEWE